jgi:hypothetical protein
MGMTMPEAVKQHTPPRARNHQKPDRLRALMEAAIEKMLAAAERLIAELDASQPDPDIEPDLPGSDGDDREVDVGDEPEATSCENHGTGFGWNGGFGVDEGVEDDDPNEHTSVETHGGGFTHAGGARHDDAEDSHDAEAMKEDGTDNPDDAGLPLRASERAAVRAARRQAREMAQAAIGQRGGRLCVRDTDSVTILGQGLARLSAPTNGASR